MADILKLARIQIFLIVLFTFFKFIRPSVLASGAPEWVKLTLLSLPNFFEAFLGTLILTGLGLYLNLRVLSEKKHIKGRTLYVFATALAAIYVLTQEFKLHNLGGNNVFDMNDVMFSIVGLVVGFVCLMYLKPKVAKS